MATSKQHRTWIFDISRQLAPAALAFAIVLVLAVLFTPFVQAQTFNVIHNFTGGGDGADPRAGLTTDTAGNFYGTTRDGGTHGLGTAFKLAHKGSAWIVTPLYSFAGGDDGTNPDTKVIFGPDGSLYGTTAFGGGGVCDGGCGTVFKLTPPPTVCKSAICPWTETVIHRFMGGSDGDEPGYNDLVFDQAGNIYGATHLGGYGYGTVYELMLIDGSWMENVIYRFSDTDGSIPNGMALDNAGNLYGTTYYGGTYGVGVVFELTPSESGWTETILHEFGAPGEGAYPASGLIFDPSGNLYGTTPLNVFSMTSLNGNWTYTSLYAFSSGTGPYAHLIMDAAGNLYDTTFTTGTYGYGSVFKLTHSGGAWTYTDLHDFTGGSDGGYIFSGLYLDANGNLYGTASVGGAYGNGVVYEITP